MQQSNYIILFRGVTTRILKPQFNVVINFLSVPIVSLGMYQAVHHTITVLQQFAQPPVRISRRHRDMNREKRQGLLQEDVSDDSKPTSWRMC